MTAQSEPEAATAAVAVAVPDAGAFATTVAAAVTETLGDCLMVLNQD